MAYALTKILLAHGPYKLPHFILTPSYGSLKILVKQVSYKYFFAFIKGAISICSTNVGKIWYKKHLISKITDVVTSSVIF